jgi:hypothetical protein
MPEDLSRATFRDMTEKVQHCFDSCKLHLHSHPGESTMFGAFEKKSNYLHPKYDPTAALSWNPEASQSIKRKTEN